ncbi:hypothetical protein K0651_03605 [Ornithinimicrobium sp. Arc0846-15]|nr:hypothetical protein [Ornithinimicrobium laminariae]
MDQGIGRRAGQRGFAWPECMEAGAEFAFGTDTPTAPHSALANLWIASMRRSAFEPDLPPNVPEFALSVARSIEHATRSAA